MRRHSNGGPAKRTPEHRPVDLWTTRVEGRETGGKRARAGYAEAEVFATARTVQARRRREKTEGMALASSEAIASVAA